jgi:tRNA dimethylallyltransferase
MHLAKRKTVVILAGPTAAGKTRVAIELAKHFKTEIISADSRQCFKELNIGVARPSVNELEKVKHHFIASHSVRDEINAATFEKYALDKVNELFQRHDIVVMVGGTGLYIKAFCDGLDDIPSVKAGIRNQINSNYEEKGLAWLQEEVKLKDPDFYKAGEIQNPQRMMRALEVVESTGQSVLLFRKGKKIEREFTIIKIGLDLPKERLNDNINTRVDTMIKDGLVPEVKSLQLYYRLNALQTVGYSEILDYLNGKIALSEAVRNIKTNTRQYAKRQMTWFRKDTAIKWFAPSQVNEMIEFVKGRIAL